MEGRERLMLRELRGEKSQEAMAEFIGVKRQYYSKVELGQRKGSLQFWENVKRAFRLSDALVYRMMQEGVGANETHHENEAD